MATIKKLARNKAQRDAELSRIKELKQDEMVDKHLARIQHIENQRIQKALRPNKLSVALAATSAFYWE